MWTTAILYCLGMAGANYLEPVHPFGIHNAFIARGTVLDHQP